MKFITTSTAGLAMVGVFAVALSSSAALGVDSLGFANGRSPTVDPTALGTSSTQTGKPAEGVFAVALSTSIALGANSFNTQVGKPADRWSKSQAAASTARLTRTNCWRLD